MLFRTSRATLKPTYNMCPRPTLLVAQKLVEEPTLITLNCAYKRDLELDAPLCVDVMKEAGSSSAAADDRLTMPILVLTTYILRKTTPDQI